MLLPNPYKRLTYAKRCLVNLKSGTAFRGYLTAARGSIIVLKGATILEPGAEPVDVSGEVLIEKANIEFIQITEV